MALRAAKGTASAKDPTGNDLVLSGVDMASGDTLVVGVAHETDATLLSVNYGNKLLHKEAEVAVGDTCIGLFKYRVKKNITQDITCNWSGNTGPRAMFATCVRAAGSVKAVKTNTSTSTDSPTTGSAGDSTSIDTICIGAFVSAGPAGDTPGTASYGHTLEQRVGTTGDNADTNVTIQETFELLEATGDVQAGLSGATARDWASVVIAFAASQTYTVTRAYYQSRDGNPDSESIVFVVADGSMTEVFQTTIPRRDFEVFTNQEVTDVIAADCQWWEAKSNESASGRAFKPDTAFHDRIASFISNEIQV